MVLPLMNKWYQSPSCRSPARVPSRRRVTATPEAVLVRGRCPTHSRCAAPSARCALSNVAMGQSGKMVGSFALASKKRKRACLFASTELPSGAHNLFTAIPRNLFQVGHSKNPNANKRRSHIEIELVRLRPTTHSKEPTCFIHPAPPRGRAARRCPLAAAAAWALKSRLYSLRIASASPRSQARTKNIISARW